jgi:putative transposase
MSNHAHFLIFPRTHDYHIAAILKAMKMPTAQFALRLIKEEDSVLAEALVVLRPKGRSEHRFWQQGGGYDRNLTSRKAIHASYDYIHNNPVKAGYVTHEAEWKWSSAAAIAGNQDILLPDPMPHMSD